MAGKDGEMFMTGSFNITPKTTEQHLTARSDKSVVFVTIKDYVRRFVLLKLTTDRHEASRGLFATAELLVLVPRHTPVKKFRENSSTAFSLIPITDKKHISK